MAWSDAARQAALEARRAHAKGAQQTAHERQRRQLLKVFARARHESRKGYVQHVEMGSRGLRISDWYDAGKTLASYEGGRTLNASSVWNSLLRTPKHPKGALGNLANTVHVSWKNRRK